MKKGQVGFVVDAFAFFAIMILLVVFPIIFYLITGGGGYSIQDETDILDAKMQTLQILRTPVTIQGYTAEYGYFISLAREDRDMHNKVKEKITPLLERIYETTGRSIVIKNPDQNRAYAFYEPHLDDEVSFVLTIPAIHEGETITLSVRVGK